MRSRLGLICWFVIVATCSTGCRSMSYADRGTLFGGLVGAGTGAAIGKASGNTGAGAVIGTAIGSLAGGAIGDGIDADVERNRAEVEARMGRQMAGAVTPQDVIAMTQAGLSENVIATHIRTHGVAQPPQVQDLINLRNQGVGDTVLQALQTAPGPQAVAPAYHTSQPIIVEERVVPVYGGYWGPPPPPFWHHRHGHYCAPRRPRPGYSVGFAWSN